MLTSGFTSTPVTKTLFFGLIALSILISIADIKPLFYFDLAPHHGHASHTRRTAAARAATAQQDTTTAELLTLVLRVVLWQTAYTNSTELLFAAMLMYQMRVVERAWGSRKVLSFLISIGLVSALVTPILLLGIYRLSLGWATHLPAGPTALVFALLVQYHAAVPAMYRYKILLSSSNDNNNNSSNSTTTTAAGTSTSTAISDPGAIILSDKATTYLLAAQLALSAMPGSALPALVGGVLGLAWRGSWGPAWWDGWRVPRWTVGEKELLRPTLGGASAGGRDGAAGASGVWAFDAPAVATEGFEGLRRRMEGERSGGAAGTTQAGERGIVGGVVDQFRGRF